MIEPAALAKPVIVGPFTANFADAMLKFKNAGAILEVNDAESLRQSVLKLLADRAYATQLGARAQEVVRQEKGATARHADEILALLAR